MRANNYSGNAVARFFVQHPEWHEARADGRPAPQLCFAVPEVRAHKGAILREAAAYGLQGLLIDTLRHPPMVGYHPLVTEAFRERFGEQPPRSLDAPVFLERGDDREGEAWERWFRFRATFFAAFLRELRAGLQADGLGHLPIHVRVAPRRALHDGADLEALLDEGLIEGVVANRYTTEPLDYERLFPLVRGRVPVVAVCDPLRGDPIDLLPDCWRTSAWAGPGCTSPSGRCTSRPTGRCCWPGHRESGRSLFSRGDGGETGRPRSTAYARGPWGGAPPEEHAYVAGTSVGGRRQGAARREPTPPEKFGPGGCWPGTPAWAPSREGPDAGGRGARAPRLEENESSGDAVRAVPRRPRTGVEVRAFAAPWRLPGLRAVPATKRAPQGAPRLAAKPVPAHNA